MKSLLWVSLALALAVSSAQAQSCGIDQDWFSLDLKNLYKRNGAYETCYGNRCFYINFCGPVDTHCCSLPKDNTCPQVNMGNGEMAQSYGYMILNDTQKTCRALSWNPQAISYDALPNDSGVRVNYIWNGYMATITIACDKNVESTPIQVTGTDGGGAWNFGMRSKYACQQMCPSNCNQGSGHGICDTRSWQCKCNPGFAGDDCSTALREKSHFEEWKKLHGKTYASEEENEKRFSVWKDNMETYQKMNAQVEAEIQQHKVNQQIEKTESSFRFQGSLKALPQKKAVPVHDPHPDHRPTFGPGPFADVHPEEFRRTKLMKKVIPEKDIPSIDSPLRHKSRSGVKALPSGFDWRIHGRVTPAKDQAFCGSCWTFATAACLEGQNVKSGNPLVSLSTQQILDCNTGGIDQGCNGGFAHDAYNFLIGYGRMFTWESYPYRGVSSGPNAQCNATGKVVGAKVTSWNWVSTNEDEIAAYLMEESPLSIAIDAYYLVFYWSGIINLPEGVCNGNNLDHAVTFVGFGTSPAGVPYWTVKNSWGQRYGEEGGYFRIIRGKGMCGINRTVTCGHTAKL